MNQRRALFYFRFKYTIFLHTTLHARYKLRAAACNYSKINLMSPARFSHIHMYREREKGRNRETFLAHNKICRGIYAGWLRVDYNYSIFIKFNYKFSLKKRICTYTFSVSVTLFNASLKHTSRYLTRLFIAFSARRRTLFPGERKRENRPKNDPRAAVNVPEGSELYIYFYACVNASPYWRIARPIFIDADRSGLNRSRWRG